MHTVYANPALNALAAILAEPVAVYALVVFGALVVSAFVADRLF